MTFTPLYPYVCTTWFPEPRTEGWPERWEQMHLQTIQECRAGAVNHTHGPILAPFLLHAPWKAGKKRMWDYLSPTWPLLLGILSHLFSYIYWIILVFTTSSLSNAWWGRVIMSWWIKYSFNLFKYNVESVFPFPHKQLHHHFHIISLKNLH